MKWSFKIGSILGIPVKVHLTFVLLLILIYFAGPVIVGVGGVSGVIFVLLVFASVVFHELSHAMVARHYGIGVQDITLLPIGGVARMAKQPERPSQEVAIAVAGPIASIVLAISFWFAAELFGSQVTVLDFSVKRDWLAQLAAVNLVLALFNLLPAFPMDGGRVLRGLLGLTMTPYRATRIAVGVGQVLAIVLFFVGLILPNFFMILIALFVYLGAETEEQQMGIMMALGGATAGTAMIRNVQSLSPDKLVGDAAELFCHGFQSDFPVMEGRRLIGLVTRDTITESLHKRGPSVPVQEIMARDFPTVVEDTPLVEVLEKIEASGYKVLPVLSGGELMGLVTLEQIWRYNMLCSGYSCEFMQPARRNASEIRPA
ncbi:MAG: site-2 protease family protein [Desulfomonile tiedjei]|nr:site-2 protease family protein [Desulfomonile tiedjei]